MAKEIIIYGPVEVVPLTLSPTEQGGEPREGKQLVVIDVDANEEYIVRMDEDMAKETGRKLRMSNKSLSGYIQQRISDAAARAQLTDTRGVDPQVVQSLLNGVHTKEKK